MHQDKEPLISKSTTHITYYNLHYIEMQVNYVLYILDKSHGYHMLARIFHNLFNAYSIACYHRIVPSFNFLSFVVTDICMLQVSQVIDPRTNNNDNHEKLWQKLELGTTREPFILCLIHYPIKQDIFNHERSV
jgi:hypothetical protein